MQIYRRSGLVAKKAVDLMEPLGMVGAWGHTSGWVGLSASVLRDVPRFFCYCSLLGIS